MLFTTNDLCLSDLISGLPDACIIVTRPGEDLIAAGLDDLALTEIGADADGHAPIEPYFVCRVTTSAWVPDGLSLAGYPGLIEPLMRLPDYPTFTLVREVPQGVSLGAEALARFGRALTEMANEMANRTAAVEKLVAPIKKQYEADRPKPWHITGFDPLAQMVSLDHRPLHVSAARPRNELSDLNTLFLRPFIEPSGRQHVPITVLSADCGSHRLHVRIGRRKGQEVLDISLPPRSAAQARLRLSA